MSSLLGDFDPCAGHERSESLSFSSPLPLLRADMIRYDARTAQRRQLQALFEDVYGEVYSLELKWHHRPG